MALLAFGSEFATYIVTLNRKPMLDLYGIRSDIILQRVVG